MRRQLLLLLNVPRCCCCCCCMQHAAHSMTHHRTCNLQLVRHHTYSRTSLNSLPPLPLLDEPKCHSHLQRVNYVLFIIMRFTHALTTPVSSANNWRIESCRDSCLALCCWASHAPSPPHSALLTLDYS